MQKVISKRRFKFEKKKQEAMDEKKRTDKT